MITIEELKAALADREREYRDAPDHFASQAERMQMSPDEYGELVGNDLARIIEDIRDAG